jgi:acetyl esterase/lipase
MKFILPFLLVLFGSIAHADPLPASQSLPESSRFGAAIEYKNIAYAHDNPVQTFDLYLPAKHDPTPLPLIFWIHGGGWSGGNKDGIEVPYLVKQGYALVSVEYRFSQVAIFPAQIQDCNAALNYVVAHAIDYNIDPKRIVVAGNSAGGHLALLLGLARKEKTFDADPSIQPRAILNYYGPTDFTTVIADLQDLHANDSINFWYKIGKQLLGVPFDAPSTQATTASPITYVTDSAPPTLTLHGKNDNLVPPNQATRLKTALDSHHILNQLILIDGAGHAGPAFSTPAIQPQVIAFLDRVWEAKP